MTASPFWTLFAQGISAAAFTTYGLHCLVSESMKTEFQRYGLSQLRLLTGWLQITASLGLLVGFSLRPLVLPSAAGLSVMMLCATIVRLAIRDPLPAAIPAISLFCLNAFIVFASLRPGQ